MSASSKFADWVASLDPGVRASSRSLPLWIGTALLALTIMLLAGLVPVARRFFELDFATAVLCFLPAAGLGFGFGLVERRRPVSSRRFGQLLLLGSLLMHFYVASLVALTQMPGAVAMLALLILLSAFHGHSQLSSIEYPYGIAAAAVGIAGGALLAPWPDGIPLFAAGAPLAIGANALLGTMGLRSLRERNQEADLRAAIHAQVLEERTHAVDRLSNVVVQMLETNHDANNSLSTSLIGADLLRQLFESDRVDDARLKEMRETGALLADSLERLRLLVEETRTLGTTGSPSSPLLEAVEITPVLRVALEDGRRRAPDVHFTLDVSHAAEGRRGLVSGGADTLHRAIGNLVLNASQGDGSARPTHVHLSLDSAPSARALRIRVEDNGPGFSARQLAGPIVAFGTTKRDGSGLGLYTVERLVRASGGSLQRANRPEGGASVSIFLEEAESA